MVLEYEYDKMKLPRKGNLVYPFKKSEIDAALKEANVAELEGFYLSTGSRDRQEIMRAFLGGESRAGYRAKSKPILSIDAVSRNDLAEIREKFIERELLSKIARWIASLKDASSVVRDVNRERRVRFEEGELVVRDEKGKKVELS